VVRSAFPWRLVHATRGALATFGMVSLALAVDPIDVARAVAEDGRVDFPSAPFLSGVLDWTLKAGGAGALALAFWRRPWERLLHDSGAATVVRWSLASAGVFVATFLLVSPMSLDHLVLIKGLALVASYLFFVPGVGWAELVDASTNVAGLALLALGSIVGAVRYVRPPRPDARPEWGVSAAWMVVAGSLLLLVPMSAEQYLLPLYPFGILLTVAGATWIAERAAGVGAQAMSFVAVPVAAAACLIVVPPGLKAVERESNRVAASPAVHAGEWLERSVRSDSRVLADHFAFIPPAFADVTFTWAGTKDLLATMRPNVVVVSRHVSDAAGLEPAVREFYSCLIEETCGYRQAHQSGDIVVLTPTAD
jgi:hypothetical protein